MKFLITGFEPFGGETTNPSYEVVKTIENNIAGVEIFKLKVPVIFNGAAEAVIEKINEINPDIVINIGQAGGRSCISLERVAINIDDAEIADNEGYKPQDVTIDKNGQMAYFSTLPIKKILKDLKDKGIPVQISDTAGTYVCNHIMYCVLNHICKNNLNIKAGFIHIPYLPGQVVSKPNSPSMDISTMNKAFESIIKTISV